MERAGQVELNPAVSSDLPQKGRNASNPKPQAPILWQASRRKQVLALRQSSGAAVHKNLFVRPHAIAQVLGQEFPATAWPRFLRDPRRPGHAEAARADLASLSCRHGV